MSIKRLARSLIPTSVSAQINNALQKPNGEGVFGKLSQNENFILSRFPDQEDLQFPRELGENEYNQFILFTSYETKGEKASSEFRQAQRDDITLGEELDIARPESAKLAAEFLEANNFNDILQDSSVQDAPDNFVEIAPGPFAAAGAAGNPALAYYTQDGFDSLEDAKTTADSEIERLTTRRKQAKERIVEGEGTLQDAAIVNSRSHESFIADRSASTIEQQKLLGIQRRVTAEGRMRLSAATEKSNTNIALYIPNKLVNSGTISYNNVSFELVNAATQLFGDLDFTAALGIGKRKLAGAVDEIASIAGVNLNAEAASTQVTGLAINPRMQQTFQGVEPRGFDFTFSFAPRSQKEAVEVSKIIRAFRRKAHPSLAIGGTFLNTPDEFEIRYYKVFNNGVVAENLFLNKIGRCALTGVNVDYTPNGINATFPDGSPVRTSLTMQFRELRPLTREDIEEGY